MMMGIHCAILPVYEAGLQHSQRVALQLLAPSCSMSGTTLTGTMRRQVRFAACMAARAFMLAAGDGRAAYYPVLLPALCFNRHDVAEGVRAYSAETWRLLLGTEGPSWVARCLPQARPRPWKPYPARLLLGRPVCRAACRCRRRARAPGTLGLLPPQCLRPLKGLATPLHRDLPGHQPRDL